MTSAGSACGGRGGGGAGLGATTLGGATAAGVGGLGGSGGVGALGGVAGATTFFAGAFAVVAVFFGATFFLGFGFLLATACLRVACLPRFFLCARLGSRFLFLSRPS